MKIIRNFIISMILITHITAADIYHDNVVYGLFRENNIDIDSKSIKGWIRIFSSREKMHDYNFDFSKHEIDAILKHLDKNNKESKNSNS